VPPPHHELENFRSTDIFPHPIITSSAQKSPFIDGRNLPEGHLTIQWNGHPGYSGLGPSSVIDASGRKFRTFIVGRLFILKMSELGVAAYNATGGNGGDPSTFLLFVFG
jgi:hypothetical protein